MADEMQFIRVGMRRNGASVKLKLRWDNSPRTCELVSAALPIEGDLWHAKYANHEIYILLPVVEIFGEDPPGEWQCMYPAPGDLMYLFHPPGLLPKDLRLISTGLFSFEYKNLDQNLGTNKQVLLQEGGGNLLLGQPVH